jgi:hypothetical protein
MTSGIGAPRSTSSSSVAAKPVLRSASARSAAVRRSSGDGLSIAEGHTYPLKDDVVTYLQSDVSAFDLLQKPP